MYWISRVLVCSQYHFGCEIGRRRATLGVVLWALNNLSPMTVLSLRLHLAHNGHLPRCHSAFISTGRTRQRLLCLARPYASNNFTSQHIVLRGGIRRSGTLSTVPPTPSTTWVDRLPKSVRPYLYLTRIDKPIGTLLLFYPCGSSQAHST